MAFSTWSALALQMRTDLASGNWRTKSYEFDGMKKEFFSPEEFLKMLEYVENKAATESADTPFRTILRAADR